MQLLLLLLFEFRNCDCDKRMIIIYISCPGRWMGPFNLLDMQMANRFQSLTQLSANPSSTFYSTTFYGTQLNYSRSCSHSRRRTYTSIQMQIPKLILFRKHLRSSAFWVTLWFGGWSLDRSTAGPWRITKKATCKY